MLTRCLTAAPAPDAAEEPLLGRPSTDSGLRFAAVDDDDDDDDLDDDDDEDDDEDDLDDDEE